MGVYATRSLPKGEGTTSITSGSRPHHQRKFKVGFRLKELDLGLLLIKIVVRIG